MAVSGNKNYKIKKEIDLGKWYLIEIEQILNKGKVGYMVNLPNIDLTFMMERFTTRSDWMGKHCISWSILILGLLRMSNCSLETHSTLPLMPTTKN